MSTNFRTWDDFVNEAAHDPYELAVGDEKIIIHCPTGAALLRIAEGQRAGDSELILAALCGDAWDRISELVATAPHGVLPALAETLMDHFDLFEPVTLVGPGGGKITRKKPREIRALMDQGYRPAGEARASRG